MNSEITYTKVGDYYLPNSILSEHKKINLGKYGRLRLNYLKEHCKAEYTIMLMNDTLQFHLIEIEETVNKRIDLIVKQMVAVEGISENLKSQKPLIWTRLINNYKYCAEEIVLKDLIYT